MLVWQMTKVCLSTLIASVSQKERVKQPCYNRRTTTANAHPLLLPLLLHDVCEQLLWVDLRDSSSRKHRRMSMRE